MFLLVQISFPSLAVPDLGAGAHTYHHDVVAEVRVVAQHLRYQHSSLLVRVLVDGSGQEHAQVVACGLVAHRRVLDLDGDATELRLRQEVDAPFLAARHDESRAKLGTELGGQGHAALRVDFRGVRAQQQRGQGHRLRLCGGVRGVLDLRVVCQRSTS